MLKEICDDIKTAIELGRTDIIRTLLEACDKNEVENESGLTKEGVLNRPLLEDGTFLYLATKLDQGDVVRTLLSCGADPGVQNENGENAIDIISSENMRRIYVDELLRATASSEVGRVCQLNAAGICINSLDSEDSKNTPLHWAACYGNRDIVSCLIDRGADTNAMNASGATPLHDAVSRGDAEIVEELLQTGANPLIQALKGKFAGKTPLDLASGKPELMALMERFTAHLANGQGSNHSLLLAKRSTSVDSCGNNRRDMLQDSVGALVHNAERRLSRSTLQHYSPLAPVSAPPYASQNSLELSPRIDQVIENLVRTHMSTPVRPLVTHGSCHLLWPQPQRIVELDGNVDFYPGKELHISIIQGNISMHRILDVWDVSRPSLLALGHDVKIGDVQPSCGRWSHCQVECTVNDALFAAPDSYQIHITSQKVRMSASSLAGLHYAICTFVQLLRLSHHGEVLEHNVDRSSELEQSGESHGEGARGGTVSGLQSMLIQDWPTLRHRGVLLDISPRGRIPTLDFLFHMIDLWSSMKVSHLHLYTRLLPSSEWQLCYSRSEMVTIDRYCQDHFVELVPVLEVDSHLCYEDLADMWPSFQEILSTFPTLRYVHVGPKLSSLLFNPSRAGSVGPSHHCREDGSIQEGEEDDCESMVGGGGAGLQELWHLLSLPNTVTLMICGNALHYKPRSPALPPNVVVVEYGFQADYDFLEWSSKFQKEGNMPLLCPGTASWNSFAGCPEASICNVYRAVQASKELNSLGVVVAHWSGSFHLTPHPFAWPGFVMTAGLSWNPATHWDYLHNSLADLLDAHVFRDSAHVVGRTVVELGHIETYVVRAGRGQPAGDVSDLPPKEGEGSNGGNGGNSTLYRLLTDPDGVDLENLSIDLFGRVTKQIKKCQNNLFRAKLSCSFAEMVIQELQLAADLMLTACRIGRTLVGVGINPNSNMGLSVINLGISNLPPTFRTDIANKLLAHIEQYRGTWLQRHLPAGLQGSLLLLTSALRRFVPHDSNLSEESEVSHPMSPQPY
ncbi:uncharacterized protein LOC124154554 isoform X2 [Ischnura elegans]|uniref:uncharacterized protein LOC124154554 isoform X2 n=1 Tax=Ischnura elegans TaxID=197161 RepID=UPI001ED872B4|nr:uncharacterized protein LOC124154554 isoform X2 [Ischnura elegans]